MYDHNIDKELEKLDGYIRKCKKCSQREHFPNKLPTYQYKSHKRILFVGRDPAKDGWRKSGKAFFKPDGTMLSSGRIFREQLYEVGIDIMDINFVELIKCFPKGDKIRTPKKDEIENCRQWLNNQIDIIQPTVIVTMGKECCEFFYGKRIELFSEFIDKKNSILYRGIEVIPIFHPSGANNKFNQKNIDILKRIIKKIGDD